MSTDRRIPPLLQRLVDDAAVFPPGTGAAPVAALPLRDRPDPVIPSASLASLDRADATIPDALAAHARHRAAWYVDLVGPLLLPVSVLDTLAGTPLPRIAVVGDTGLSGLPAALAAAAAAAGTAPWAQFEVAVAKRGEDPQPGLRTLLDAAATHPGLDLYAEIPLTWGLLEALDTVAAARGAGTRVAPKFRTGGLAAELFPTPVELAAVVCACRDRDLPFKLTAGLHHALRHTDPETGFTHHGFLNLLAATLTAVEGAEVAEVAELLGSTDPLPIVEVVRGRLARQRPLWVSFGAFRIDEPLTDLTTLGLLDPPDPPDPYGRS